MSKVHNNIKVGIDEELEEQLKWMFPDMTHFHILRQSVDARRKHEPHFIYSVEVFENNEPIPEENFEQEKINFTGTAPLIIGAGPAGLFAAVRLVEKGIPCHIFEQGSEAGQRLKAITKFWRYGTLNLKDNVCFGEGGAGLYSDGKLITRIKSPHISYVMNRLVKFGAPKEIEYLSNPHVGSDRIRRIIPKIREYIQANGGQFHFNTKVTELNFENKKCTGFKTEDGATYNSDHVILAGGHSTDDLFEHLCQNDVYMEGKSFAMGLRVEHPQSQINEIQYRQFADHPKLGSANYKLTYHNKEKDFGVYSFCMCPGGYVLSSGTETDGIVCNGMSNYRRNSPFANAAIVTTVNHEQSFGDDLFGGLKFRRSIEHEAYLKVQNNGGSKELPAQNLNDFLEGKKSSSIRKTSCPSGVSGVNFKELLPTSITEQLQEGLLKFGKSMKGFQSQEAVLHGVETRTSCPLRITRDKETLQSLSHEGLYPTGEGAGYAGGITSAACDGINVADAIASLY